jgi:hypothetical protein
MGANYVARDTYTYGARWFINDFTTANPAEQIVRIDSDSDFAVQKIAYSYQYDNVIGDAADRPIGHFQLRIFDSTTGRYWDNGFVEIDTIAGTGTLPFVLPTPKVMVANSEIKITLRAATVPDPDTQPAFFFILNFIGDKLFRG